MFIICLMAEQVAKIVNAWNVLPSCEEAVLLVGLSNTGRSTIAELVNKFQHQKPNSGLSFEKDKYILENIISAKTTRIQTTVPTAYPSSDPKEATLLDVPCYCMPPELKKWTVFDQKMTVNLMLQSSKKVGFLLFIE